MTRAVELQVLPVQGLPEVRAGDDLAALIAARVDLVGGDVVVVAQKIVSKAEGSLAWPEPGEERAAARTRLAREHAVRVVVDSPRVLVVETHHGLICAAAGIDGSNVPGAALTLLPPDPDGSAAALRAALAVRTGVDVAVIVTDTFGRPWRAGVVDVAIGVAGLRGVRDERGGTDREGRPLEVTQVAVADELAAAADLVRGKAQGVPAVVVRGYAYEADEEAGADCLRRDSAEDLFRRGRGGVADAVGRARPVGGPVAREDLTRAAATARRAGGPTVTVTLRDAALVMAGPPLDAGVAAGAALAAFVDLGYAALREPSSDDGAAIVVRAGAPAPGEPEQRPRR